MSETYLLSTEKTEITITDDSLIIENTTYLKNSSSTRSRIQWFLKELFIVFAFLLAAGGLAYFYLYSATIECARSNPDAAVICNVTKNYYMKPNEVLVSNETIKEIHISRGSMEACRLEVIMGNNRVIFPLNSSENSYSSGQCSFPSLEPLEQLLITDGYNRTIQVGSETVTVADNAMTWIFVSIFTFFGVIGLWVINFEGALIRTTFDRKTQIINMEYINIIYGRYEREYSFDDVSKILFKATSDPKAITKYPRILFKDSIKEHIVIYGDSVEKSKIVEHIKKILA